MFWNLSDAGWDCFAIGIGIFTFNPEARFGGDEWIDLQPLGTEGQWLADPENRYPEPYELTQFNIPFGGGLRFRLSRRWDMEVEIGWRKTFTDYLDDVADSGWRGIRA